MLIRKAAVAACLFFVAWVCVAIVPARAQAPAAQEVDEAATRQFAAAVALQKRELYDLAAEEWLTFVKNYATDPRVDRGYHYLGICYLKDEQYPKAVESLSKVIKDYPKFALLDSSYLYLGVAQYNLGRAG